MSDQKNLIADFENTVREAYAQDWYFVDLTVEDGFKILDILKKQEPRMLTLEELKQFGGHPCWFESCETYMGKTGFWIIPSNFRTFYGGETVSYVSVLMTNLGCRMVDCGELGLSAYNKMWRCWSSRPTKQQMEEVKWDGPNSY